MLNFINFRSLLREILHAPIAIFPVMHERERYFNVVAFLGSAALNDSKWALRGKLPITMLGRSCGKIGEPL